MTTDSSSGLTAFSIGDPQRLDRLAVRLDAQPNDAVGQCFVGRCAIVMNVSRIVATTRGQSSVFELADRFAKPLLACRQP